jgi:hypothetical protein
MGSTSDYVGGDGFRSFEVPGLAPETSTPTGMRDDLLLLSWLIVLLRTREDGQASYEWAYDGQEDGGVHERKNRSLSTDQVEITLQSKVGEVAAAISRQIITATPDQAGSTPATLLLSTGSLSRTAEGAKDEVSRRTPVCCCDTRWLT